MKNTNKLLLTASYLSVLVISACASQEPAPPPVQPAPAPSPPKVETVVIEQARTCDIPLLKNPASGFSVRLWPTTGSSKFYVGQELDLQMESQSDVYASIYHVSTSCKTAILLENQAITAGEITPFPDPQSGMTLMFKPPTGVETYLLVVTREPFNWLAQADVMSRGAITTLDLSPRQLHERMQEALNRLDPNSWNSWRLKAQIQ